MASGNVLEQDKELGCLYINGNGAYVVYHAKLGKSFNHPNEEAARNQWEAMKRVRDRRYELRQRNSRMSLELYERNYGMW